MSELKEQMDTSNGGTYAKEVISVESGNLEIKNIVIPNSEFRGLWKKDVGYSIGYESVKLTKDYETLEEALNQIGYGVDNEDELVKYGDTDYEMIIRVIRAVLIVMSENKKVEENAKNN